jgi:hypothetical protein
MVLGAEGVQSPMSNDIQRSSKDLVFSEIAELRRKPDFRLNGS